jgi:hypothetical protein
MSLGTLVTSTLATLNAATAPTCVVLSYPLESGTLTHSSGDTRFFPLSTYTALTTTTYIKPAYTFATCISPGDEIPTNTISGLTPIVATASTCVVQSLPAEYYTMTYSSGESVFLGTTTYTAITTVTSMRSAHTLATCFTPGEILPLATVATAKESIRCSTKFFPESTKTITYLPGVSGLLFATTRTVTETSTSFIPAFTDVQCNVVPDYQNQNTCNAIAPLTWVLLVITFITIQLTWWIFDVPLLWTKGAGIGAFLDSVAWKCLKAHAAGSAGVISGRIGSDSSEFARIYYIGKKLHETSLPPWSTWKLCASIVPDLLTIVSTVVTLYEACTLPRADARRHFGVELWVYPTLPAAIIGLSLLAGERFFSRTRKGNQLLLIFIITLLIVVEAGVSVVLWKFDTSDGISVWWISVIFYTVIILPLVYIRRFHMFSCAAGCFVRVGGVTIAAFNHYAGGQPYCKMSGKGFAVVYLVMGAIAAILAFVGGYRHAFRINPRT